MTRILIVAVGSPGRWNPLFNVVKQLLGQGHDIAVLMVRTHPHAAIDPAGDCKSLNIPYLSVAKGSFPAEAELAEVLRKESFQSFESHFRISLAAQQIEPVRKIVREVGPDWMLVDNLAYQGVVAASCEGVPYIGFSASNRLALPELAFEDELKVIRPLAGDRDALFSRCGVSPTTFRSWEAVSPYSNIVPATQAFVGADAPVVQPSAMVGPFRSQDRHDVTASFPWERLDPDKPLVYVSLGTIWTCQPYFFSIVAEAAAPLGVQLVVSAGKRANDLERTLPGDVIAVHYAPQIQLLERATCFISHGGMNSVNDALCCGVPMAVFPQASDQFAQGYAVERAGVGIWVKHRELTISYWRTALVELTALANRYRTAIAPIASSYSRVDGVSLAAQHITEHTTTLETRRLLGVEPRRRSV